MGLCVFLLQSRYTSWVTVLLKFRTKDLGKLLKSSSPCRQLQETEVMRGAGSTQWRSVMCMCPSMMFFESFGAALAGSGGSTLQSAAGFLDHPGSDLTASLSCFCCIVHWQYSHTPLRGSQNVPGTMLSVLHKLCHINPQNCTHKWVLTVPFYRFKKTRDQKSYLVQSHRTVKGWSQASL